MNINNKKEKLKLSISVTVDNYHVEGIVDECNHGRITTGEFPILFV